MPLTEERISFYQFSNHWSSQHVSPPSAPKLTFTGASPPKLTWKSFHIGKLTVTSASSKTACHCYTLFCSKIFPFKFLVVQPRNLLLKGVPHFFSAPPRGVQETGSHGGTRGLTGFCFLVGNHLQVVKKFAAISLPYPKLNVPLYWLLDRDPYNGLLFESPHKRAV